jgi:hypothetical protein
MPPTTSGARHETPQDQDQNCGAFVPLLVDMLEAPATKALSHGVSGLYVGLKRQYNPTPLIAEMVASISRCGVRSRRWVQTAKKLLGGTASCSTTASS